MIDLRRVIAGACITLALLLPAAPARADDALFSFGEMRELQRLTASAAAGEIGAEALILYQNMEFYTFTVFETLLVANNTALALHREPLFCAPPGTFRFDGTGDIALLAGRLTSELLDRTRSIGVADDHYDERPASEALLTALRAAFPCPKDVAAVRSR